jgi:hypothetical protein
MGEAIRSSYCVLGISAVGWSDSDFCVKARDIEIPMAGGLYITSAFPDLRDVFSAKEVLTYGDIEELIRLVKFVKQNEEWAETTRSLAQAHALACHTWVSRVTEVTELCEMI